TGYERHSYLWRGGSFIYRATELSRPVYAGIPQMGIQLQSATDRAATCRSLRGQRSLGPDESVGEVLRRSYGIPKHSELRRQGHLHRILGVDEQSDEQRERLREVSNQRAGGRQKEIAGGRISGVLRRRRRATHRDGDKQHH